MSFTEKKMKLNKTTSRIIASSVLTGLSIASVYAEDKYVMLDIVDEMSRFSEVATITKQNEHYQPYIISVFHGKELEKLGVLNVKDALSLVPGVDVATDNTNYQTAIFRGSNPFAFGQSKLMIDGVLVNDLFLDGYAPYLNMPINLVKRIEVVRGPGSKTDGVNAYAGSINIITYAESIEGFETGDKLFLKAGSYQSAGTGFVKTYKNGKMTLVTDFYYQQDDKTLPIGWDAASTGSYNFPHLAIDNTHLSQSGEAPLWLKNYSLGMVLQYEDFSLNARTMYHKQGSAYGINSHLPNDNDHMKFPSTYIELSYNKSFDVYEIDIKSGVKFDAFYSKAQLVPPGYQFPSLSDPLGTVTTFTDGFYGIHEAQQRTLYQSSYLKYSGFERHLISIGYRVMKEETYDITTITTDRDLGTGLVDYTDTYTFFNKDAERRTFIFSLQDKFDYSNNLSFMYGMNIENNSINDIEFDPRLSMVYQPDALNIYKVIFSRSHRNPSWQEMYTVNNTARVGNPALEPETVQAFEAAYIRKLSSDHHLQANLFYLLNKDQIDKTNAQNEYRNSVDTDIYGLEVEYKSNITMNDQLYLNYSFVNGKDNNDASLSNVAKHLVKGYYLYHVTPNFSASGIVKYVGEKGRLPYDAREKVDDYMTLDMALRYEKPYEGYDVTLSVKNLFDACVTLPSEPMTYVGDYPQEGRHFMIIFNKAF